jgi:hypothetical protein
MSRATLTGKDGGALARSRHAGRVRLGRTRTRATPPRTGRESNHLADRHRCAWSTRHASPQRHAGSCLVASSAGPHVALGRGGGQAVRASVKLLLCTPLCTLLCTPLCTSYVYPCAHPCGHPYVHPYVQPCAHPCTPLCTPLCMPLCTVRIASWGTAGHDTTRRDTHDIVRPNATRLAHNDLAWRDTTCATQLAHNDLAWCDATCVT